MSKIDDEIAIYEARNHRIAMEKASYRSKTSALNKLMVKKSDKNPENAMLQKQIRLRELQLNPIHYGNHMKWL